MSDVLVTNDKKTTIQYEGGYLGARLLLKAALGETKYKHFETLRNEMDLFEFTQENEAGCAFLKWCNINFIWWC